MSDDFDAVRAGLERNTATSARNEALAALDRIYARLRDAETERDRVRERVTTLRHAEAERNDLQGAVEEWEELALKAQAQRDGLRRALEHVIEVLHETSEVSSQEVRL